MNEYWEQIFYKRKLFSLYKQSLRWYNWNKIKLDAKSPRTFSVIRSRLTEKIIISFVLYNEISVKNTTERGKRTVDNDFILHRRVKE